MFSKILIANRGEIALRIIRACRELGIRSVIAFSEADRLSLPVRLADERICIGPAASSKSYLNLPNLIAAALIVRADAIHPGYGFLAENADMAELCQHYGVVFIGPSARVIEQMGDKSLARRLMREAGLPVIPGSDRRLRNLREADRLAAEIGYPLVLKAVAGGGGRGIRVVKSEAELERVFPVARMEVEAAFGLGDLYLERLLEEPRHVEVQVLFDHHGNGIHIADRDCSLQRRHQKMLEEAIAPGLPDSLHEQLALWAVQGASAIGYTNAGTVEFLVDREGQTYFLEMNPRIQVEHPVTEMVAGVDIVKSQILIAAGEPLPYRQDEIVTRGHAIECRITAEDSSRDFAPQVGTITEYVPPAGPGIRVDSHLYPGYALPSQYDSLLAKVIAWGRDRGEAVSRMDRALAECVIEGVPTSLLFHRRVLADPAFREGNLSTRFLDRFLEQ